jgi:hypothetical protein
MRSLSIIALLPFSILGAPVLVTRQGSSILQYAIEPIYYIEVMGVQFIIPSVDDLTSGYISATVGDYYVDSENDKFGNCSITISNIQGTASAPAFSIPANSTLVPCMPANSSEQSTTFEASLSGTSAWITLTISHAIAYPDFPVIQRLAIFDLGSVSSWDIVSNSSYAFDTLHPAALPNSIANSRAPGEWQGTPITLSRPAPIAYFPC